MIMPLSASLLAAWRAWRRLPAPLPYFHAGHRHAPAYGLALDLDHARSSIAAPGQAITDGQASAPRAQAGEGLAELAALEAAAATVELLPAERAALRDYLEVARRFLEECERL